MGFKHIFWLGNTCPDIHLSISDTRKHWREVPSSSTKHQLCLPLEMGACVAEVAASGCGELLHSGLFRVSVLSNAFCSSVWSFGLLAAISKSLNEPTAPLATSALNLMASVELSAALSKKIPVE